MAFMLAAFGQIPINDYMIGRLADGEWRARIYGVRYVVSFTVLAAALPLIAFVYENWGFDALFRVLAVSAARDPRRRAHAAAAPAASRSPCRRGRRSGRLRPPHHRARYFARKRRHRIGGGGEVALAGEARAAAGPEIVIAVACPVEADSGDRRVALDLGAAAEGIALALHDQRRTGESLEMGRAQLLGLVGRMERVAEADEPDDRCPAAWSSSATRLATRPPIDLPPISTGAPVGQRRDGGRYSSIRRSAFGGGLREPPCRRAAM